MLSPPQCAGVHARKRFFVLLIATELQCPNSGCARCSLPNTRFLTASDGYTKDLRHALLSSFSPMASLIRRVREIGVGWPPVRQGVWTGTGLCLPTGGSRVRGGFHSARGTQELVASRDTLEARPLLPPSFLPAPRKKTGAPRGAVIARGRCRGRRVVGRTPREAGGGLPPPRPRSVWTMLPRVVRH